MTNWSALSAEKKRKYEANRRGRVFTIRLAEEEYDAIKDAAASEGATPHGYAKARLLAQIKSANRS